MDGVDIRLTQLVSIWSARNTSAWRCYASPLGGLSNTKRGHPPAFRTPLRGVSPEATAESSVYLPWTEFNRPTQLIPPPSASTVASSPRRDFWAAFWGRRWAACSVALSEVY